MVKYEIEAEVRPTFHRINEKFSTPISPFFVTKPQMIFPKCDIRATLENKVGGFLGMGTTQCFTEMFFDRNEYHLGEVAHVKIICDNSKCKKAVKEFKLKLSRTHTGHAEGHTTCHSQYIVTYKAKNGIKKETKAEIDVSLQIPTHLG